jgi:hypothetical protein
MLGFHAFATLPALLLFLPQLYLFLFGIDSNSSSSTIPAPAAPRTLPPPPW